MQTQTFPRTMTLDPETVSLYVGEFGSTYEGKTLSLVIVAADEAPAEAWTALGFTAAQAQDIHDRRLMVVNAMRPLMHYGYDYMPTGGFHNGQSVAFEAGQYPDAPNLWGRFYAAGDPAWTPIPDRTLGEAWRSENAVTCKVVTLDELYDMVAADFIEGGAAAVLDEYDNKLDFLRDHDIPLPPAVR